MDRFFWIGFVGFALAIAFALVQAKKVMGFSEGTEKMQKIAASIREGANAYLKRQYTTVAKVFAVVFVILLIIAFASGGKMLSRFTPFAFLTGGIWSMLAGLIGMKIATNSNARTAQAASESLNKGLRVAFSSGSVMGFTVVGLGILDISIWFTLLYFAFGITDPVEIGTIMVMNGMGASFMALFARVGGGIYTKAADVGADLVGKVEAGIPEDDPVTPPPSPTTWATTWVTWPAWAPTCTNPMSAPSWLPSPWAPWRLRLRGHSAARGPGLLRHCSAPSWAPSWSRPRKTPPRSPLLKSLRTGTYVAAVLSAICAAFLCYFILGDAMNWLGVFIAILCGLVGGCAIGYFTEYFTSDTYKPTQKLAMPLKPAPPPSSSAVCLWVCSPPWPPSSSWPQPS